MAFEARSLIEAVKHLSNSAGMRGIIVNPKHRVMHLQRLVLQQGLAWLKSITPAGM